MFLVFGAVMRRAPLVAVVGATGTGKTRLGVELARVFPAEIVSADSMQVYRGLDIVTAKPTAAERAETPHHLLDLLEPHLTFTVLDFRNRALRIIENLIENGKMPIVVGGTHYYVESVLWRILVEEMDDCKELVCERDERERKRRKLEDATEENTSTVTADDTEGDSAKGVDREDVRRILEEEEKLRSEELYRRLQTVDPAMAERLHPNNRRKVVRALDVWVRSGRRHSEILAEQAETERQLRNKDDTIVLWLKCDQSTHDARLEARVDSMVEAGMVREMLDYHARYNLTRLHHDRPPDYTKGIFQTLGFKEFHDYLMLSDAERESEVGAKLLARGLADMKTGTRQYARKQNKIVRARFLDHPTREIPPIYELDTTDLSKWDENVKNKAIDIIESHMHGTPCVHRPLTPSEGAREKTSADIRAYHKCEKCDRVFIGDIQYNAHMKSNKHKRMLERLKKAERRAAVEESDSGVPRTSIEK